MKKECKSKEAEVLRQKAEALLKNKQPKSRLNLSEAETMKLIHEMEIHQIELELQNEELALAKDQDLKAAAEKYAELYNFAPAGIFTLTPKGEITEINLYGSQMLGKESLHLKNSVFNFFVSDDTKPIFNVFLNKIFKSKTEESCQVLLSGSENPPMYLQLTGLTTKNGEQCLVTAVDISKLKRMEEALAKSETKYRTMITQSPDGFFTSDLMGNFLSVNKSMCDILKYSEKEFLSMKILDIVAEQNQLLHKLRLEAMLNGEITNENAEYEIIGKDGIVHSVEVRSSLISKGKEPIGFQGIAHEITERKRADRVLRESEEKYRNIFENIQDVYYETTIDGIILELSPSIKFMSRGQFNRDDLIGKSMYNFYTNTSERQVLISTLKKQGSVTDFEVILKTPNGLQIPCSISAKLHFDDSGKPLKIIGNLHDITKRKQTEKALIASETRYRRLFESAKDGILILDAETGKVMDVNPFLVETLGYTHEQFIEKTIWEIGFFKDIIANHDKFLELQQKEYVRYDNLPLETINGRKINVEFVSNVYLVDKKKVIQCNIRDITERKRIENALIFSETHLRMLVQTIPDLIWTKDADGIYLSCNAMFQRFFGASEDNIIGKSDYDFVDRKLADFFRENDRKAMAAGKPTSNEEWITFADDGHSAYLETIKAPMYDNQNILIGVLGIGRDITDRKKAIDELKEKNTFIQIVLDNLPIGIALNKIDSGNAFYVNKKFEEIYGWTKEEMKDIEDFFEKVYPDKKYREELAIRIKTDMQSGNSSRMHWENCIITHKDGSKHNINAVNIPLFDQNTMVSTVVDITERKQAEKEITMLAQSLKSINECVSVTDLEDKILFVNESLLKTYGYDNNELIGKSINILRSQNNTDELINRILPTTIHSEWHGELLNKRKDGTEFPIYLSTATIKDNENNILGLIGVATDITERKRAEETLIKLSSAVEQTVDLIVITDRNGIIEYVNRAFEELTGYSSEEVLGKTPRILKSGTKNQEYYEGLWKAILSGNVLRAEMLNKKKNGDLYYEEKSISPILDKNNNITHFVSTGLDITNRKLAEKELIEAKDKAEENDRLKTAFLQNISHEIRTPMNAIVGFSELVEMEIDDPEKIKDYVKIIRQRSNDLLGIINDLLDIARIESDQLSINYNQIDLNLLFEDIRSLYAEHKLQIEKSSINLIVKGIPTNFNSIVSTDIGKLKQIFSNLIHNAFKFTSEGKIEFGFHSISNNNITFFVSDTGPGIAENIKDLIFERFRKSANESIYVQDGMGLGLAIVKGLLKLFKGKIRIESEPNKGSTFYFTIPYIPISVKTVIETPAKNQKYEWSKFKLLIVEDDKFNIAYFIELFTSTGINLLFGETGSQAISLFTKNQNIDLVLMDIKLPDMSGYEVTIEFKKMRPKIPIIAQTAYAAETDKQKALDAGCDDFITKPIKRNIFLEILNGYLISKPNN